MLTEIQSETPNLKTENAIASLIASDAKARMNCGSLWGRELQKKSSAQITKRYRVCTRNDKTKAGDFAVARFFYLPPHLRCFSQRSQLI